MRAEAAELRGRKPDTWRAYLGQVHAKLELRDEMQNHTALVLHDAQLCLFLVFIVTLLIFR